VTIFDLSGRAVDIHRRGTIHDVRRYYGTGHTETREELQMARDGNYVVAKVRGVTDLQVIHISRLTATGCENEILVRLREIDREIDSDED